MLEVHVNEIQVNSGYICNYSSDVKNEITGVLYHEDDAYMAVDGKSRSADWFNRGDRGFCEAEGGVCTEPLGETRRGKPVGPGL